jgi:hypothetical protein
VGYRSRVTARVLVITTSVWLAACASADQPVGEPVVATGADIEISVKSAEPRPLATATVSNRPVVAEPPSGIAKCEEYWARLRACNERAASGVPLSAQDEIRRAFADAERQTKEAWQSVDAETLGTVCSVALDALSNNPNCPSQ